MAGMFDPVRMGDLDLANRVVMAPMTRSRADEEDRPTDIVVDYYRQRAGAGLIVTEGVQPSAEGKGYARTPGLYNDGQVAAWRRVTDAVHAAGGRIVAQLMHVGRIAHAANRQADVPVVAPSAVAAKAKMWTEAGELPTEMPRALGTEEIQRVIADYADAARRAIEAGFDGIELHCTSGYLPAQFMASGTNQRTDGYGGDAAGRTRFAVETLQAISKTIGAGRTGFRICPGNPFNDLFDEDPPETHAVLLRGVRDLGLAYCHVIAMPTPQKVDQRALVAAEWNGATILNNDLDRDRAAQLLAEGACDAVSFARAFIANPDLVERFRRDAALAPFNPKALYGVGAEGYSDYPTLAD
ncbi:alkene reductase [Pacificimonas sp. ICDLI1SI03]